MKTFRILFLLLASSLLFSCSSGKVKEYPMFWTWLDYRADMNFDSVCAAMKESGLDGVMLNAPTPDDYRKAVPVAKKYGIEVYAWVWTMNAEHDAEFILREHPDWLEVNRKGESLADKKAYVGYYNFMTPSLPGVLEHIRKKIEELCKVEDLGGVAIDYHRMVDVILPTRLWLKYGIIQDKEYPEWDYGYHPAMLELFREKHGYDPLFLEDPSADEQWLQFRCDQITEVANEIAGIVHSHGKVMAASPFPTPSMAKKMVRQDWGKWNLDIVFPMVYHNFYTGDLSFISDCMAECSRDKNPSTTLGCGMTASDGNIMFECMDQAFNNGAKSIAIFTIAGLGSPETRKKFREYADSLRSVRAEAKAGTVTVSPEKAETDPFKKSGIMSAVRFQMLAYISFENAMNMPELKGVDRERITSLFMNALQCNTAEDYQERLLQMAGRDSTLMPAAEAIAGRFVSDSESISIVPDEYKLLKKEGAVDYYRVKEVNSGKEFNVIFYLYGGILSGWNVEPSDTK